MKKKNLMLIKQSEQFKYLTITSELISSDIKTCNKLENNYQISNKKALFHNLVAYLGDQIGTIIPKTFHIVDGENDPKFQEFLKYKEATGIDIWIVKPGENSNRGSGIEVISKEQ